LEVKRAITSDRQVANPAPGAHSGEPAKPSTRI
jgi:hypothetical protein